ncbi:hypothetical protein, partial [Mesorhizobium sp. M8A.F.Ca.ET.142.01.1.1]|uniref:hypothetical protein n=1 Tax=Mesorhizobium sp. M8A.F.Ca.ET.142.01.1.1 TaxID=2563958 RepID=UPI00113DD4E4
MQRRDFIRNASLALAAFGLPSLPACAASRSGQMGLRRLGQPQPFDFATLKGQAPACGSCRAPAPTRAPG